MEKTAQPTVIDREWARRHLPERSRDTHKGSFGTLAILAGSTRYRGAAVLAASAALRAGAGLVRLCSTEQVCAAAAAQLPACILLPLEENAVGGIAPQGGAAVLAEKHTAILTGCGLGNTADTAGLIGTLLTGAACPLVLDADALNVLAGALNSGEVPRAREEGLALLQNAKEPVVLTPHIGEMARLCGQSAQAVADAQEDTAAAFATQSGCIVVLKSYRTVVATPAGKTYLLDRPNPALARGGTGDVLAGIIASLMAQGIEAADAAAVGVWLHAEAGRLAARKRSFTGASPADLPAYLCEVWLSMGR